MISKDNRAYMGNLLRVLSGNAESTLSTKNIVTEETYRELMAIPELEVATILGRLRCIFLLNRTYNTLIKAPFKALSFQQLELSNFRILSKHGIELFEDYELCSQKQPSLQEVYNRLVATHGEALKELMELKYLPSALDCTSFFGLTTCQTATDLEKRQAKFVETNKDSSVDRFLGEDSHIFYSGEEENTTSFSLDTFFLYSGITGNDFEGLKYVTSLYEESNGIKTTNSYEKFSKLKGVLPVTSVRDTSTPKESHEELPREEIASTECALSELSCTTEEAKEETTIETNALEKKENIEEEVAVQKETEEVRFTAVVPVVPTKEISNAYTDIVYIDCDNMTEKYIRVMTYIANLTKLKNSNILVHLFIDSSGKDLWSTLESSETLKFNKIDCPRIKKEKSMVDVLLTETFTRDKYTIIQNAKDNNIFTQQHIASSDSDFGALGTLDYKVNFVITKDSTSESYLNFLKSFGIEYFDLELVPEGQLQLVPSMEQQIAEMLVTALTNLAPNAWTVDTISRLVKTENTKILTQLGGSERLLSEAIEKTLDRIVPKFNVETKTLELILK